MTVNNPNLNISFEHKKIAFFTQLKIKDQNGLTSERYSINSPDGTLVVPLGIKFREIQKDQYFFLLSFLNEEKNEKNEKNEEEEKNGKKDQRERERENLVQSDQTRSININKQKNISKIGICPLFGLIMLVSQKWEKVNKNTLFFKRAKITAVFSFKYWEFFDNPYINNEDNNEIWKTKTVNIVLKNDKNDHELNNFYSKLLDTYSLFHVMHKGYQLYNVSLVCTMDPL